MLFRLVIAFVPRSKRLLISWLQSLSAVIFEPKKIKSVSISIVSPSLCHEVMGTDGMIFIFWMLSFKCLLFGVRCPRNGACRLFCGAWSHCENGNLQESSC